jgi:biotin synthase
VDKKIGQIVSKALDGGEITPEELRQLFGVDYLSEESFVIQYASRKIAKMCPAARRRSMPR